MSNLGVSAALGLDAFETSPLALRPDATENDYQIIIRAVYKQVLGNAHVLESDRLNSGESLLRNGDLTVRGFVRLVAQSQLYRSRFFEQSSPYRWIELNCKHLLGRAPQAQVEIARHVLIYHEQGYTAEINSYLDSDEYISYFGENIVPYPRNIRSQVGNKNIDFNRMFAILRGSATSDLGQGARLIKELAANLPSPIKLLAKGSGNYSNIGKRFRITVSTPGAVGNFRRSSVTYEVSYAQLSQKIQNLHRLGVKIVGITEITTSRGDRDWCKVKNF